MTYGLVRPTLYPLKHLKQLFTNYKYREYCTLVSRYGKIKRFTECNIIFNDYDFLVPDVASFLSAYREIFLEGIYSFCCDKPDPLILDCGANVGVGVFFFKKLFPRARIIAYEADPQIYKYLTRNINTNKVKDVTAINKAVWTSDGPVGFCREGADGGKISISELESSCSVNAESFQTILENNIFDFIKIDIEGAEVDVLRDKVYLIRNTKYVFVEYHSFTERKQGIGSLISEFEMAGFRCHVHPPLISKQPFKHIDVYNGMDMQLNLFFIRD
jgi:FkbM family methyltransferase